MHSFSSYLYSIFCLLLLLQSPDRILERDYFILSSKRISEKEYTSRSFPFTYDLLLLYLLYQDLLLFSLLCLFCSFPFYFILFFHLFVLCPFLLHYFLLSSYYDLPLNVSFLPFIPLDMFFFLFTTCCFGLFISFLLSLLFCCLQLLFICVNHKHISYNKQIFNVNNLPLVHNLSHV